MVTGVHPQTPEERAEAQQQAAKAEAEEQYHRRVDRWTLIWSGTAAIATGLLVVVGIGGTRAAINTLKEIKRQADLMKEQSDLMVEKERAKLRIELHEFRLVKDKHDTYNVEGAVSIYGNTEAFIDRTEIYASIGAAGIRDPLPEWSWGMHLPSVIRPVEQPIEFKTMVMGADGPAGDDELLSLREAQDFIYCIAKIEFSDAFGRGWGYQLKKRFGFFWSEIDSPGIKGKWDEVNETERDNTEYRREVPN